MMAIWLGLASAQASADTRAPGKVLADACGDMADLGPRILCNLEVAALTASTGAWDRLKGFLPGVLAFMFMLEVMKLLWQNEIEGLLEKIIKIMIRTIFGLYIITSGSESYTSFYTLYSGIRSTALALVADGAQTVGLKSTGGTAQMASVTGILTHFPDQVYGGMTLEVQSAVNADLTSTILSCPDLIDVEGIKILKTYFSDFRAMGNKRMMCLADSIAKAGSISESAENEAFFVALSGLTNRSTAKGGAASERYGSAKKTDLVALMNSKDQKKGISMAEIRQIEDTLFLWSDLDSLFNKACEYYQCTGSSTYQKAKAKGADMADAALTGGIMKKMGDAVSGAFLGLYNMIAHIWAMLIAIPYYLITAGSWCIIIVLSVAYFRLAFLPAIVIPFILVFYTAWWASSPMEGQIPKMIGVYKSKIIKFALGPAVVVVLVSVGLGLFQGMINIFVQGGS